MPNTPRSMTDFGINYEDIDKNPIAVFEWFLNHPKEFGQLPVGQRDKILQIAESQAKPMKSVDLFDPDEDDVDWITTHFWIPELKGPIWLADYQKTMLNFALERDENGLFVNSLVLWSDLKKSIKCERKSTLLWMADGTHKRADAVKIGDKLYGWNNGLVIDSVIGIEEQSPEPVYEILTNRGRSIVVTGEHPFLIEGMKNRYPSYKSMNVLANKLLWVKAKDLTIGRRVVIGLDKNPFEPEIDYSFYAFGAYIGDGSQTVITSSTPEIINGFKKVREIQIKKRKDTVYQKYAYGIRNCVAWLNGFDYDYHNQTSYTKRVPKSVFKATKQQIASFLSGYFDADGCIVSAKRPRVQLWWSSVNRELLSDCQKLLASIGINAILRSHASKYKGEPYADYMLVVSDKAQAVKLANILTLQHPKKARRLKEWKERILSNFKHRFDTFDTDRIVSIKLLPPEKTIAIETKNTHTHITNGMVTHNSTIAAAVALRRAFQLDWGSIKVIGNDQKQAQSRSYYYLTRAIRLHPEMSKMVEEGEILVHRYKVTLMFNNTTIEAIPVDPSGEAGGNDDHIVWTEAWSSASNAARTLWTEMVIPPQKFGRGLKWVETYAGYVGKAPILEPLYTNNVDEKYRIHPEYPIYKNERTLVMWNQVPRLPWQTPEYYAQQAIELEDDEFRRVHKNEWVSKTDTFLPGIWWDECEEQLPPLGPKESVVLGVDAAVSGDCFAIVGVTKHPNDPSRYAVRLCRTWIPPKGGKLLFKHDDPEINRDLPDGYITDLCKKYRVKLIEYDAYQLHSLASEHNLARKSAFWEEFSQGGKRLEADSLLYQMIRGEEIAHPGFPDLTEHINNADAQKDVKNDNKLRLVKSHRSKKIDAAVALSMALYRARSLNL